MSTLTVSNIQKTGETASRDVSGVAAAWCTIGQTGTTALKDSLGVTSVTDNGTGKSTLAFTNDFSNQNYAAATAIEDGSGFNDVRTVNRDNSQTRAVGQFAFYSVNGTNSVADDADYVNVIIHGGLA